MNAEQFEKWNQDRPRRQAEFTQLVKPLIKFLNENYSPYANIVITCDNAELSQTDVSLHTEEFFVD
jgi:hypothetical protein